MATNNRKNSPSLFVIGIIAMFVFAPIGFFIIFIAIISSSVKSSQSQNGTAEKKTDYSGMSKMMTKGQINHNHSYDDNNADYCGAAKTMIQNRIHNHAYDNHNTDYCGTESSLIQNVSKPVIPKKRSVGYSEGKTTEQIYNELVNRKTDYSGVDPNILRRG